MDSCELGAWRGGGGGAGGGEGSLCWPHASSEEQGRGAARVHTLVRPLPPGCVTCLGTLLTFLGLSFLVCMMGLIARLPGELSELIHIKGLEEHLPPAGQRSSTLGLTAGGKLSVPGVAVPPITA